MTGDTVGGVWTFTLELAEELCARGSEIYLVALGGMPSPAQRREADRIAGLHLLASDFKLEWMEDPWEDVQRSGRWLLELERQHQPDLIHLNSFAHGDLSWRAPVALTAHSCVLSWWAAVKPEPLPDSWTRYRRKVSSSLAAVDMIAAPSRPMLESLRTNYTVEADRCRVVHNGRDASRFHAVKKEPFILAAGRLWDAAKNMRVLAQIAPHLNWPVYLAGAQENPNGTPTDFSDCRLLGQLASDELANWYARASIYASPALYEPFGLAALEAAHSGCALVLADIPSHRYVWEDAALFVPPNAAQRWKIALRNLIGQPELRAKLAQRSGRRAKEFTTARMCSEYLNVYRQAVERRRACVS